MFQDKKNCHCGKNGRFWKISHQLTEWACNGDKRWLREPNCQEDTCVQGEAVASSWSFYLSRHIWDTVPSFCSCYVPSLSDSLISCWVIWGRICVVQGAVLSSFLLWLFGLCLSSWSCFWRIFPSPSSCSLTSDASCCVFWAGKTFNICGPLLRCHWPCHVCAD